MPSSVSYQRKYYSVLYADLGTIPLKEGNVIATYDTNGFYYDVGNPAGTGQNVVRRQASSIEFVGSLEKQSDVIAPVFSDSSTYDVDDYVLYREDDDIPYRLYICTTAVETPGTWTGSTNWAPCARPEEPTTIYIMDKGTVYDEEENEIHSYSGYVWSIDDDDYREIFNNCHDFKVQSVSKASTKAYLVASESQQGTVPGTLIKNPNIYITTSNKVHADIEGNADTATRATTAALADEATIADNDINSNPIAQYYVHSIESDFTNQNLGTTLTINLGDSNLTPQKVYIQDTVYSVYNQNTSGLVNGYGTTVLSDSTGVILSGSGWINLNNITMPTADKAAKDADGNVITSTYVANGSYDTNTQKLTLTKGDGITTVDISIPDTQYPTFSAGVDGLVAAPSSSTGKFLQDDNTWQTVTTSDYVGATSLADGVHGLVPAALAGEEDSYLKGDATWGGIATTDTSGLVPGPASADDGKFLQYDATLNSGNGGTTWTTVTDTKNTAGATNDTANLLYLVGASAQGNNPQTYSNVNVYIDNNTLYSNNKAVVNLSDTQALTNKTYEGYTLGDASTGTIGTSLNNSRNTTTTFSGDGSTTQFTLPDTSTAISSILVGGSIVNNYTFDSSTHEITFTSAPASGTDNIAVTYVEPDPGYNSNYLPTTGAVKTYVDSRVGEVSSGKLDVSVIAGIYDSTQTYTSGDFCMYEDVNGYKLYKCTAVSTTGDFAPGDWTATTIIDVILSYHP